jgi:uncharacterized protein (DUF1499 family)
MLKAVLFAVLALVCLVCALMFYRVARSAAPANFGQGMDFAACDMSRPNCVSSLNSDADFNIAPLQISGTVDEMRAKLLRAIATEPRAQIVWQEGAIVEVTFRTALFGFPDDARFRLDAATNTVQLHSQSRVGYSDLGVNRKRLERIRQGLR